LEGLGYSAYTRIVPLQVVGDLMGGTVRLAWRKLRPSIEEERRPTGSAKPLNGSNGSPPRWTDICRGRPIWKSGRRKPISLGNP